MRSTRNSALRNPLDYALGSTARTRVLRALALHGGFVNVPGLVLAARVDPVSVRSALRDLEALGLVETQGGPRSRLYHLNARDSLSGPIRQIFKREMARWSSLEDGLRLAARELGPRPTAAWLFGSSARREDLPQSDIDVMLVADEQHLAGHVQELRDRIWNVRSPLARRANVTGMTEQELLTLPRRHPRMWSNLRRDVIPLIGKMPDELLRELRGDAR